MSRALCFDIIHFIANNVLLYWIQCFSPLFHRCVQAHVLFSYRCVHHHHHVLILIAEEFQSPWRILLICQYGDAKCLLSCHHFWLTSWDDVCWESIFCCSNEGWPVPKGSKCNIQGYGKLQSPLTPQQRNPKKLYVQYCTNVCNLWNGRFWLDSYSRLFYPMAEQQRIVDGVLHLQRFRVICQAQIPVASVTNFIPYLASK